MKAVKRPSRRQLSAVPPPTPEELNSAANSLMRWAERVRSGKLGSLLLSWSAVDPAGLRYSASVARDERGHPIADMDDVLNDKGGG